VDEPIILVRVYTDTSGPPEAANFLLNQAWVERSLVAGGHDAEIASMSEGVLTVRGHMMALLAKHLVQLWAAIPTDDLDSGRGVPRRESTKQLQQSGLDGVRGSRGAIA
jgi:hypothetical protein